MQIAFKEWAVVVDALGQGRQSLILRKGGISEGKGGFRVEHPAFLFFPTLFHQQRDAVRPEAQARFDSLQPTLPAADRVRIEYWAEITEARRLIDLPQALGLRDLHVWTDTTIAERFDWGREEGIWVLILRVYRLAQAVELPMLPEYGGCKSWIELQASIDTRGSVPVVADSEWNHYLGAITERLGTPAA